MILSFTVPGIDIGSCLFIHGILPALMHGYAWQAEERGANRFFCLFLVGSFDLQVLAPVQKDGKAKSKWKEQLQD